MVLKQSADPQYRSQLIWSVTLVALIGAAGLWWSLGYLDEIEQIAQRHPHLALRKMTSFFQVLVSLGMLDLGSGGAFILWLGQRTLSSGQYPPPNTPVARDTLVLTGAAARRRGKLLFLVGNSILILTLGGGFFLLWWLPR